MQKFFFTAFLLIVFCIINCKDSTKPKEEEFTGILQVDEFGNILGGDTTDFQPRPLNDNNGVGMPLNYSLIYAFQIQ